MKIYLWGQRNFFGGGVHFASFSDAMKRLNFFGSQVQEVDMQGQNLQTVVAQTTVQDTHVLFFPINENLSLKGFIIKWGIFESDILPTFYIEYLSNSDLIWVPSQWARQVLISHGIYEGKVDVVPEGVDPSVFHPFTRDIKLKDDTFRFYMLAKKEDRKGFSELLEGFKLAFDNDPSVLLCLKADKEIDCIAESIKSQFEMLFVSTSKDGLLMEPEKLSKELHNLKVINFPLNDISSSISKIKKVRKPDDVILIFGSHYIANEIFSEFEISFDTGLI